MKQKTIIRTSIALGIFILVALGGFCIYESRQIPDLKVVSISEQAVVEVSKHPFSWSTLHTMTDYAPAPTIAENQNITLVDPESELDLTFSNKPDTFQVTIWDEKSEAGEEFSNNETGIKAPAENGTYVFSVIGKWEQGQVLYVFKITVK